MDPCKIILLSLATISLVGCSGPDRNIDELMKQHGFVNHQTMTSYRCVSYQGATCRKWLEGTLIIFTDRKGDLITNDPEVNRRMKGLENITVPAVAAIPTVNEK